MQVSPLSYSYISYNRILPRHNPSFGSSDYNNISNPNTDKACVAAQKLLSEMTNRILSIQEMGKLCEVPTEVFDNSYGSKLASIDFVFSYLAGKVIGSPTILVPLIERTDKIGKTVYVMNFVHELTHKYQIDKKEDPHHQLTQDTLNAGFKLGEIGNDFTRFSGFHIERISGYLMRRAVSYTLGSEGLDSYSQNGGLVLTNARINSNIIAMAFGYIDEDDFVKNFVKDVIPIDEIVNSICTRNPILANKCVDSPTIIKEKVKTILVKYFKNSSKVEKEAYLTENKVAKSQGYNDKATECIYNFHAMVEKAFDYYLNNM